MGEGRRAARKEIGWTNQGSWSTKDKEKTPPQWYVNGQGQTMVVIPGPVEFMMGSPPTEAGQVGRRVAAQEADWSDVRLCSQVGDGGAISAIRRRATHFRPNTHGMADMPVVRIDLVSGGDILQLAEQGRGNRRRSVVLRDQGRQ